jgi:ABC-type lipoprotein release transport system permease subunit
MYAKIRLVFRLFKKPFFFVTVLYFVALVMLLSILGLKESYKMNLQQEFATKQPHIKVLFINDNTKLTKEEIEKSISQIYKVSSHIENISPFVKGTLFVNSFGSKATGSSARYQGEVKVIGVSKKELLYDFNNASFASRAPFNIKYTPVEFLYTFQNEKNSVVFNETLFNSYFPVVANIEKFVFIDGDRINEVKFSAIFKDYDKQAIIYTNIDFANQLLNNEKDTINGFFVNAKNLEDIDALTLELKETLPKERYIVKSWLEDRKKQFMMFYVFDVLSIIIMFIIVSLSLLFILLLLYNAIVKKSYQLSVLLTIGFKVEKEIYLFIIFYMLISTTLSITFIYYFLELLVKSIGLEYSSRVFSESLIYIFFIDIFFAIISYFLIKSSYRLKAKSIF